MYSSFHPFNLRFGPRHHQGLKILFALFLMPSFAKAATYTVTNLDDSGPGSLRQAIIDANATFAADKIEFQAGLTGTITLTSGELAITSLLTINGPGADVLAVSGNKQSRIFNTNSANVTIQGITIKDGRFAGGGGIYNAGILTLKQVVLSGNTGHTIGCCGPDRGGAIYNNGSLTLSNSLLTGNSAEDGVHGGAIANRGALIINNSAITNNQAEGWGAELLTMVP